MWRKFRRGDRWYRGQLGDFSRGAAVAIVTGVGPTVTDYREASEAMCSGMGATTSGGCDSRRLGSRFRGLIVFVPFRPVFLGDVVPAGLGPVSHSPLQSLSIWGSVARGEREAWAPGALVSAPGTSMGM